MVELNEIKIGDQVYWMGSSLTASYGHRRVPATVNVIKDQTRVQIKIETPAGVILKYVSCSSLSLTLK